MKSIGEALATVMEAFAPVGTERRALLEARGLFLAATVSARWDLPPFDNSAMDGYAVRAEDLAGASESSPRVLVVAQESRAGGPPPGALARGSACRIFTGAPMPEGADAVVIQERIEREGDQIRVAFEPEARANIRHRATDLRAGQSLLPAGACLGAAELGLLASQGVAAVTVHRPPVVAIVCTGDELRDISDPPRPGTIVSSNGYALAAQVSEAGGLPRVLPLVPDRLEPTVEALRDALTADLVLTCGGVSVGDYDFVHEAFRAAGISASFWKVAMKPGKPLAFGTSGRVPVLGLPGNPVSAMVTFEVFARPGIRRMLGDPLPYAATVDVELDEPVRHGTGRVELARALLQERDGQLFARPRPSQGSGSVLSMVGAEALLVLPADQAELPAGTRLRALPLRARRGSAEPPRLDG